MRNPHDVLLKPVVTEKSTDLMQENKYTLKLILRLIRLK